MILLGCRKISVAAAGLLTFGIDRGGGKNHFLVRANRRKVPKKISNTKIVSDILFFSAFFSSASTLFSNWKFCFIVRSAQQQKKQVADEVWR